MPISVIGDEPFFSCLVANQYSIIPNILHVPLLLLLFYVIFPFSYASTQKELNMKGYIDLTREMPPYKEGIYVLEFVNLFFIFLLFVFFTLTMLHMFYSWL